MGMFSDYWEGSDGNSDGRCVLRQLHTCPELIAFVRQVGFLPLLDSGIHGYVAESLMAEECRYTEFGDPQLASGWSGSRLLATKQTGFEAGASNPVL